MPKVVINQIQNTAQYYTEDLGNEIGLEMVLIPGGSFMMGSPEGELKRSDSESPQHLVNIQQFCIGKYPVTQEQWKAVAAMPQVNRELDPDPSNFKGANRPVEEVSWYDAVEFCDRLTAHTKRNYCLSTEAEWEYACRAGTITPFHFGETITSELANYRGTETYGAGVKGTYREETTEVGSFGVANNFGLYDMHGNVWEWCRDHWHDNYKGAPTNGGAWLTNDNSHSRLLRGGSWVNAPENCRSAYRNKHVPDLQAYDIGFRVVCNPQEQRLQIPPDIPQQYRQLRDLLAKGQWQQADKETHELMKEYIGNGWTGEKFFTIPCEMLREIDKLWMTYSSGHFSFSVQKEIYLALGGKANGQYDEEAWKKFGDQVGWRVRQSWIKYENVTYGLSAPRGSLPFREIWFNTRNEPDTFLGERFAALIWRLVNCNI
ncbi:SUMF1/EgtB/PvdO family nonheme iron enzyme [Aulosira sp. FACHB-615]|uniref:SUMF1/EgtB/PvdO family nonheme iron enzyme n=1 Tax=Aulosira sp. FACHB-615 TaxID=2692777 RepID=UPI001683AC42|nr:SUMF1/EgtB/PvdO family nonheme iron enzyme [Aulosira sp. FACHB-615]MBD2491690.1 SUMF1/EgtB/PvdO family nonheme iron enzyme [Aulosira sp. FACHB-615]